MPGAMCPTILGCFARPPHRRHSVQTFCPSAAASPSLSLSHWNWP